MSKSKSGRQGFIVFSIPSADIEAVRQYLSIAKIKYKDVLGVYKGVREESLLVSDRHEGVVMQLCKQWNEESILYVDAFRHSYLRYMEDDRVQRLGIWEQVLPSEIKTLDAYTFDYESATYWVC